jgi:dolichol-phosphate mannosyltransferase
VSMQDTSSPTLSLIAPTYNERENIPILVERVHKALDGFEYELIVVDDNSPDGTAELAESLSHKYPVSVICRKNEKGLASAVLAGFNCAKGEVLGVIDADLQHPPEKIPELLQAIQGGADIAVASRYIPGGGIKGWTAKRKIMSSGATMMARTFLPSIRKVKDPMSGFFLVRRRVIEGVELKPIGYKILLETLAKGKSSEVTEIPYTFEQRALGESNLSLREQLNYLEHIFILARREREIRRFLQFCLVGASGYGVQLTFFWLLTRYAGLYDLLANIPSIEASILSNFLLNDIWTFKDRRISTVRATLVRCLKFHLISSGYAAFFYAGYIPLTRYLGMYDLVAWPIAAVIGTIWNFGMNTFWTWRRK